MDELRVHINISAAREDVYDVVADMALRPAFAGHWLQDFRLAHPKSKGVGGAARYKVHPPLNPTYLEGQIVEAERPRRIVEAIHGGRNGRTRGGAVWELTRQGRDLTRVELTIWTDAGTPRERVKERLGTRRWTRRHARRALERLRKVFEEPSGKPLARTSVAAWEPLKAPRFGESLTIGRR